MKIPEGLNTANLRLIFVWETVNWFQDSAGMTVSVSSKIDNVEFVKSIVDYVCRTSVRRTLNSNQQYGPSSRFP